MVRNGEIFDMKFNVRNIYVLELRGFIYNEIYLLYILCIFLKNVYYSRNMCINIKCV